MNETPPIRAAIVASCERGTLTLTRLVEASIAGLRTPRAASAATVAAGVRPGCGSRTTVTVAVAGLNGIPWRLASSLSAACAGRGSRAMKSAAIAPTAVPTEACAALRSVCNAPSSSGLCSAGAIFVVRNAVIAAAGVAAGIAMGIRARSIASLCPVISRKRTASSSSSGHERTARNQSGANGIRTPTGRLPQ